MGVARRVGGQQEARQVMRRIVMLVVAATGGLSACGCGLPGWYRAAGHFPGVAVSDYAFYYFNGTASQLFPNAMPDTEGAAMEALLDLGFKVEGRPERCPDGVVKIHAQVPDGRPAEISLTPQNDMSNMRITIGPGCIGDEMLSRDIFKRVSVNFGTLPRDYTPVEGTLSRRIPPLGGGVPPRIEHEMPPPLQGEGLRPGQRRGTVADEENPLEPGAVPPTNLLSPFGPSFPVAPPPSPGMFDPPATDIK